MTITSSVDQAIEENASGPAKASGDSGSVEQHDPLKQLEVARYAASKKAANQKSRGVWMNKLSPPGRTSNAGPGSQSSASPKPASRSSARSLNRARYAEHPVGGAPQKPKFQSPGIHPALQFYIEGVEYAKQCMIEECCVSYTDALTEVRRLLDEADAMCDRSNGIHSVADHIIDSLLGVMTDDNDSD